jgi:hypothetical protein
MSLYRKAFLVWWTALLLFIAFAMYSTWDELQPGVALMSLAVVTLSFGSWLPSAFLRVLRPEQSH